MMKRKRIFIPAISFVILGIANALAEKFLYEQEAHGLPGRDKHKFVKPFFFSTTLFFGVSLSLVGYIFLSIFKKDSYPPIWSLPRKTIFEFIISGFFDLFQGVMSSVTSALIGVSIDYMLRSATLVGVSLISCFYFNRRFKKYEWIGIGIVTISLILVGLSSVINAESSTTIHVSKKLATIILILKILSQTTYAIELSLDQYYTQIKGIHVMIVSGMQSFWAFLIGAFVLIPFANKIPGEDGKGLHEDFYDTILMLKNSQQVVLILGLCVFIESIYQISSISLTDSSSAVVRTLIESFRTFLLWLTQLAIFYGFRGNPKLEKYCLVGEEWSKGSWLQLFAYFLLLYGLMKYRGMSFWKCRMRHKKSILASQYEMVETELPL
ncbi:hypothetical protein TRFO_06441 [Tritrichomonas foetus]|uniref:Integral membrane protein n=1 Tax=Tritrichomonas foetus TaxID=1144522 RepID=A0A1J4K311_9EUKA|nr:hypothetical protein TRFO_06441 [Tritrichomonas foetus]|eukprot:OHT04132.1 hypothetical protein TRFO_06441 [Tritrichomonas foetus]